LKFTAEIERDNIINYLDISIQKTPNNLKTSYTGNLPSQTPSSLTPPTTPHSTNTQQLNFSLTDLMLTTFKNKNTNKSTVSSKNLTQQLIPHHTTETTTQ
jgi:hypothetical protein